MSSPASFDVDRNIRPSQLAGALTVEETAMLLRVSSRTVRRRIARYEAGDQTAWPTHVIRLGRLIRIPAAELGAVLGSAPAA